MPVLEKSSYKRPKWLFNRHLETIKPALTRRVKLKTTPTRVRLTTNDGDFLSLDEYLGSKDKLLIVSHGLEGDSSRGYIRGMARHFHQMGWSVVAWNYRGCGGEMNRTKRFYHSGATYDLHEIVQYAVEKGFESIALAGFSLGGNLTLKYMGEDLRSNKIKAVTVFSVPIDLAGCSSEIDKSHNFLYSRRFLKSLNKKMKQKAKINEEVASFAAIKNIKTIYQFDDLITAPLHGFDNADHYYTMSSSMNYIQGIKVPTLVVNALNDPFLSESCFNKAIFENSEWVHFELPRFGGHVGFSQSGKNGTYWSEERAFEFISQYIS